MTDLTLNEIIVQCERYWSETDVPASSIDEMKLELRSHLAEAAAAGKDVTAVVGTDLKAFAETWAEAHRGPVAPVAVTDNDKAPSPVVADAKQPLKALGWSILAVLVLAVVLTAVFGPKEDTVDLEQWRWIWIGATLLFGVGEMLTAGFFLLPFAVGAAVAALLAFLGVPVVIQLIAFVAISVVTLVMVQRFARRDEVQYPVGANRYLGANAVVLEEVSRHAGTGMVRMGTEQWRATTDLNSPIPPDLEVTVVDVRGTQLVVVPANGRLLD